MFSSHTLELSLQKKQCKKSDVLLNFKEIRDNVLKYWIESHIEKIWIIKNDNKKLRILFHDKSFINPILNDYCIYHPSFPETFFHTFELIEIISIKTEILKKVSTVPIKINVICTEDNLGTLEAILLHADRMRHLEVNNYYLDQNPNTNILHGIFKFNNLSKNQSADIQFIDTLSIMESVTSWELEEHDMQLTLNWLISAIKHTPPGKIIIIRLRHLCHLNWIIIIKILEQYTSKIKYHHAHISNANDSSYFAIGIRNEQILTKQIKMLKRLYQHEFWKMYFLTIKLTDKDLENYRLIEQSWKRVGTRNGTTVPQTHCRVEPINFIAWLKKMGLYIKLSPNTTLKYIS